MASWYSSDAPSLLGVEMKEEQMFVEQAKRMQTSLTFIFALKWFQQ